MAQAFNDTSYRRLSRRMAVSPDHITRAGIAAFESFYERGQDLDNPSFYDSQYATRARRRGVDPRYGLKCLLDFVFIWLVEGDAAKVCPTFESYLLCVIGLIEQQRYETSLAVGPNALLRLPSEGRSRVDIFYWGAAPGETEEDLRRNFLSLLGDDAVEDSSVDAPDEQLRQQSFIRERLQAGHGFVHPALDRNIYDACRNRFENPDSESNIQKYLEYRDIYTN